MGGVVVHLPLSPFLSKSDLSWKSRVRRGQYTSGTRDLAWCNSLKFGTWSVAARGAGREAAGRPGVSENACSASSGRQPWADNPDAADAGPPTYHITPQHKQKAPTKAGAFRTSGAGNSNRTYDLRITNPADTPHEQTMRLARVRISTTRADRTGMDRRQRNTLRDLISNCPRSSSRD